VTLPSDAEHLQTNLRKITSPAALPCRAPSTSLRGGYRLSLCRFAPLDDDELDRQNSPWLKVNRASLLSRVCDHDPGGPYSGLASRLKRLVKTSRAETVPSSRARICAMMGVSMPRR
jgi:hypothetical protein